MADRKPAGDGHAKKAEAVEEHLDGERLAPCGLRNGWIRAHGVIREWHYKGSDAGGGDYMDLAGVFRRGGVALGRGSSVRTTAAATSHINEPTAMDATHPRSHENHPLQESKR